MTEKFHGWAPGDLEAEEARLERRWDEVELLQGEVSVALDEVREAQARWRRRAGDDAELRSPSPEDPRVCALCHRHYEVGKVMYPFAIRRGRTDQICAPCLDAGHREYPHSPDRCVTCGVGGPEFFAVAGAFCSFDHVQEWWRRRVKCQNPECDCIKPVDVSVSVNPGDLVMTVHSSPNFVTLGELIDGVDTKVREDLKEEAPVWHRDCEGCPNENCGKSSHYRAPLPGGFTVCVYEIGTWTLLHETAGHVASGHNAPLDAAKEAAYEAYHLHIDVEERRREMQEREDGWFRDCIGCPAVEKCPKPPHVRTKLSDYTACVSDSNSWMLFDELGDHAVAHGRGCTPEEAKAEVRDAHVDYAKLRERFGG